MTLYKKGTYAPDVVVSSTVYLCSSCGYTTIFRDAAGDKTCPHCSNRLQIVSSHAIGEEKHSVAK